MEYLRAAANTGVPYDIALVDALMPQTDGFTVVDMINSEESIVKTTVLMISSADRSVFAERMKQIKVDGYLTKPVTKQRLLEAMMITCQSTANSDAARMDDAVPPVPLHILIADDTVANQKVVQAMLRKRGHNVCLATNGREAIEKATSGTFDVILMDVQMPTVDGLQATRAIRESSDVRVAATPIIAMTAHAMRGDAKKCLEVGMNAYISKPIDSRMLIQLIERWAGPGRSATSPQPMIVEEKLASSRTGKEMVTNFDAALARLGGNRQLLLELMAFFREDVPVLIRSIEEGMMRNDHPFVERASHSIKGLAANFDASQVVALALGLEKTASANRLNEVEPILQQLQDAIRSLEGAFDEYESRNTMDGWAL
jgi:CheY-like chemotaxis protein/HPt (histidine-containing phosphotransfer) domain-containing protein